MAQTPNTSQKKEHSKIVLIVTNPVTKERTYTTYNTKIFTEKDVLQNAVKTQGHKEEDCQVYVLDELPESELAAVSEFHPKLFLVLRGFLEGKIKTFRRQSEDDLAIMVADKMNEISMRVPPAYPWQDLSKPITQRVIPLRSSSKSMD